jgi:hypothetical protein
VIVSCHSHSPPVRVIVRSATISLVFPKRWSCVGRALKLPRMFSIGHFICSTQGAGQHSREHESWLPDAPMAVILWRSYD